MRKVCLLLVALFTFVLLAIALTALAHRHRPRLQPVGDPLGKRWQLVFRDEFNGTSVDRRKWRTGFNNNNVTTRRKDCLERGGNLILYLPGDGTGCNLSSVANKAGATGYALPIGGYVEARVRFPGRGTLPTSVLFNWCGFWTAGRDWPGAGEIDIAETLGRLTVNYHSPEGAINTGSPHGAWGNSWHVYGAYRGATQVRVYWDGKLVRTINTSDNGKPQPIRFNNGWRKGSITRTGPAGDVLVDWVRAWQ
jgi:hypothetical protein